MGRSSFRATAWTPHSAPAPASPFQHTQPCSPLRSWGRISAPPKSHLLSPKSFSGFNTQFNHNFIQQFNNCGTSAISEMDNSSARGGLSRKLIPYLKARIKLSREKLNCVSIEPGKQRSVGALGHPGCAHPWAAQGFSWDIISMQMPPKAKHPPQLILYKLIFFFCSKKKQPACAVPEISVFFLIILIVERSYVHKVEKPAAKNVRRVC